MQHRVILVLMVAWPWAATAAQVIDATGRTVQVPDHVVPAGPSAAVLLEAVAPDLMVGWPSPLSEDARAMLSPEAAKLPRIPRVTGRDNVSAEIKALKPDLILDYGTVSPRYADLAKATQQQTGVPTILLGGRLSQLPDVLRTLGAILHREERSRTLATLAEALLTLPASGSHSKVLYAHGGDGLTVAAPGTDVTEVFARLGWQVVAPEGQGTFRAASIEAVQALDPDVLVFSDSALRETVDKSEPWKMVREGRALVAPSLPFGWIEEPPSINRPIGLAWLSGRDPVTLAALSDAVVYGRTLTPPQRDAVLAGVQSVKP